MNTLKSKIIYFLLLIPFFEPAYVNVQLSMISKIFDILKIASFVVIFLMYFTAKKKSKIPIYILIFELILLFSTFVNNGDIKSCILNIITIFGLSMICDYGINNNTKSFLFSILLIFEILITVNLITILLFPNGMYTNATTLFTENWFLGYDNSHVFIIIPALILSLVYSYYTINKISFRTIFLFIISFLTIIIRWQATGVTGLILLSLYLLFSKFIKNKKIFNIKTYLIVGVISFISIIIYRIQNIFAFFIVGFLKKSLTFTGRVYIWDYVIEYIKKKPLLGYGMEDRMVRYFKTKSHRSFHAHNQMLEITYQGGIFSLVLFVVILLMTSKKLYKYRQTKMSKMLSFSILLYLILMLTEVCNLTYIFLILIVSYNIDKLIIKKEVEYEN